jgi:hypothetical protein
MEALIRYSEETKQQLSTARNDLTSYCNLRISETEGIIQGLADKYELP